MAADCAVELKKSGVSMVSLWPGAAQTEHVQKNILDREATTDQERKKKQMFEKGESVEFAGKSIRYLAADGNLASKTGRILMTAELAEEYGFQDVDGRPVASMRQVNNVLGHMGHAWLASIVPDFVRIPYFLFHLASNKF